ncbi:uncharacterized protein LOC129911725 [Episyrphus balteatus]|uniref:uncharacterized protein LOC129911725 n=1 Tax=Episyrphus balteatus TaxID=286459 RepID=UPI0024856517|nr:uncharacterized protein LOC129911725 [Episyrphus balteatus]
MHTKYNNITKVWTSPSKDKEYCGLGELILTKLKEQNQERAFELFYDRGIQLTVGDIRRQTITVAQNLQRIGVTKGDTVVMYSMSNEKVTPIAFACYTIGAPINFFETNLEGDDIKHVLQQVDAKVIIIDEKYRSRLSEALESSNLPNLKHVLSLGSMNPSVNEVLFRECGDIDSFQPPQIEDPKTYPAALLLTSGTTGLPKIIMHSHAVLTEGIFSWWNLERGNKIFCFSPLRWISTVSIMLQPVFYEVERIYTSQEPSGILGKELIDSCSITHFFTVPAMYLDILKAAETSGDPCSLSSLKIALVGGEPVSEALIEHFSKAVPNCKPAILYGMTEFGGVLSSDEDIPQKNINGGELRRGFMVKIIDDNDTPLGPNKMGQLCVKRTSLEYLKYLKNDKANKENFLEGGWLNTGDYGYMDSDNFLNIVTRYKYLVRSGGNIIIPNTVEKIIGSHPRVQISVLIGHPNPEVENDEIGTLFVVLRNDGGNSSKEIEKELMDLLKTKCTKEQIQAVRHIKVISEMPLTSCGKVDRTTLKSMAIS